MGLEPLPCLIVDNEMGQVAMWGDFNTCVARDMAGTSGIVGDVSTRGIMRVHLGEGYVMTCQYSYKKFHLLYG